MNGLPTLISPPNLNSVSTQLYRWQGWTSIIITILAQAILQLRIYALYSKNKRVLITMGILFILSISGSALVMTGILSRLTGVLYHIPPLGEFCMHNFTKLRIYYTFWIPSIAFDVFLSVLAISKSFRLRRALVRSSFRHTGEKLVDVFFRDSAIYFVVITATYITCMLVWIIGGSNLTELPLGFAIAFPCVVSNRMVLNLRGIRQRSSPSQTGVNLSTVNYGTSPSFGFAVHNQTHNLTYLS
ncbi:hypothetical protein CPC08DRAFT_714579 [Agrocybe pediades]|nr:hypothetical protein CPC08DRAFT_714579 [Agrocybe pediades]